MDSTAFFLDIVAAQKGGSARGVYSVCSAHSAVLEAALVQAGRSGRPALIESTANQVNQEGGYTGMTPEDFRRSVHALAAAGRFPADRIILGGDHLGPYPWRAQAAETAMRRARELVAASVRAGYAKIHLDASMPLGDDPPAESGALDARVAAEREADLASVAEAAWRELRASDRDASPPVYVIGTEVPPPGGIRAEENAVPVTPAAELRQTVAYCEEAFQARSLGDAWRRVIACVAQPGMEFGDHEVHRYDRGKAGDLCRAARELPGIVMEGHSTDYQIRSRLKELVEDGVAILKVGPALTFALRECLFGLEAVERELFTRTDRAGQPSLSLLQEVLEKAMLSDPRHWSGYYTGTEDEKRLARRYSLSDRCRYYWSVPEVRAAQGALMSNLERKEIPLPLLSQFLPREHRRVVEGVCEAGPAALLRESVLIVLEDYAAAVSG
jgi:D-tagatose-1,6-bisphosphate aldolase subunit GatZ/KbaZ